MAGESNDDQIPAGDPGVCVSALEHPMVLAALARMASSGAWQHVIDERPLSEALDIADAEFLLAAGAVTRVGEARFQVALGAPMYTDPQAVADSSWYMLRRAFAHAEGGTGGWANEDLETVSAFGRVTGQAGDVIADQLLPQLPGIESAFRDGSATFLDVGVGVGAIAIRLVHRFPGIHAVGLDVLPEVLDLAQAEVGRSGLSERIELRLQSVADLRDEDSYDLAWVPQGFIPKEALLPGLHNVFLALKPGGLLLVPLGLHRQASDFDRARMVHSSVLAGGNTIPETELVELLQTIGFEDLAEHPVGIQILMTAAKR